MVDWSLGVRLVIVVVAVVFVFIVVRHERA
jgi:hypothetical protein